MKKLAASLALTLAATTAQASWYGGSAYGVLSSGPTPATPTASPPGVACFAVQICTDLPYTPGACNTRSTYAYPMPGQGVIDNLYNLITTKVNTAEISAQPLHFTVGAGFYCGGDNNTSVAVWTIKGIQSGNPQ